MYIWATFTGPGRKKKKTKQQKNTKTKPYAPYAFSETSEDGAT